MVAVRFRAGGTDIDGVGEVSVLARTENGNKLSEFWVTQIGGKMSEFGLAPRLRLETSCQSVFRLCVGECGTVWR